RLLRGAAGDDGRGPGLDRPRPSPADRLDGRASRPSFAGAPRCPSRRRRNPAHRGGDPPRHRARGAVELLVVAALFALALATALPLGVRLVARELGLGLDPRLSVVAVAPAIVALLLAPGVAAGALVLPWAAFSAGVFALASLDILRDGIP